jgi:hypothetical protein
LIANLPEIAEQAKLASQQLVEIEGHGVISKIL